MFLLNNFFAVPFLITAFIPFLSNKEVSTQADSSVHVTKKHSYQNFHTYMDDTPLMQACQKGDVALNEVRQLIKNGADINAMSPSHLTDLIGTTVLGYAIHANAPLIINELLQAGVNPNGFGTSGHALCNTELMVRVIPALTCAISENMPIEIIKKLVEAGAEVNLPDPLFNISTPLNVAALLGQTATVKYLLEVGANKGLKNCHKKTALDYAQKYGHQAVVSLLGA